MLDKKAMQDMMLQKMQEKMKSSPIARPAVPAIQGRDFFGGKKNTTYAPGGDMQTGSPIPVRPTDRLMGRPMPTGRPVPAEAVPGEAGYPLNEEELA